MLDGTSGLIKTDRGVKEGGNGRGAGAQFSISGEGGKFYIKTAKPLK